MRISSSSFITFIIGLAASATALSAAEKWTSLFDGKSLAGWKQVQDKAKYFVRDGAIVGVVTEGATQNSFLITEAEFGDFIFECEFKAAPGINSGIQFRSHLADDKVKRLYGYQFEIDPTPRGLTGGFYEEGRRGWFVPSANNGDPQKAFAAAHAGQFKAGEWNKVRIEARGAQIKQWLNGHLMAEYTDKADDVRIKRGFFGLQVHATKNAELFGREVEFRNLRVQKLD
jgi:hypothetical protein